MCIGAPGKVIEIQGKKALIEYPGQEIRQAFIADSKVTLNDYVLVQMGIIISILTKEEAKTATKAWKI